MGTRVTSDDEGRRGAIAEQLAARLGLHFPPERWPDLLRRVATALPELGYADLAACLDGLLAGQLDQRRLEVLASHLTVGESYFFRDPEIFAALAQHVFPALIRERRETARSIRVWSAGCSSGEEPYSIAMTLARLLPDLERWRVSVLATDINPRALAAGRAGIYGNWSFRHDLPPGAQRWLGERTGGRRAVVPALKSMVNFAWLNLVEDPYPAIHTNTNAMDVVFCRNVLMYFDAPCAQRVVDRLAACLLDGGWLVVSPVETSLVASTGLVPWRTRGAMLFRKTGGGAVPVTDADWLADWALGDGDRRPVTPVADGRAVDNPLAEDDWSRLPLDLPASVSPRPPAAEAPQSEFPGAGADPGDPRAAADARLREARELADQGRLPEALARCQQVIASDRLNVAAAYLCASMQLELGDSPAAMAALQRCIYLDHRFVMAHFALGNLLLGRGRRKMANRHYRNALELLSACDPESPLPESDGMAARRLREIIEATLAEEAAA